MLGSYNCFNRSLHRSELLPNENWPTWSPSNALSLNVKFIILIRQLFKTRIKWTFSEIIFELWEKVVSFFLLTALKMSALYLPLWHLNNKACSISSSVANVHCMQHYLNKCMSKEKLRIQPNLISMCHQNIASEKRLHAEKFWLGQESFPNRSHWNSCCPALWGTVAGWSVISESSCSPC